MRTIDPKAFSSLLRVFTAVILVQLLALPQASGQGSLQVLEGVIDLDGALQAARVEPTVPAPDSVTLQGRHAWILLDLQNSDAQFLHLATPRLDFYRFYSLDGDVLATGGSDIPGCARPVW